MAKKPKKKNDSTEKQTVQSSAAPAAEVPQVRLPAWAKVLVVLTIGGWVAFTAAIVLELNLGIQGIHRAQDPAYIAQRVEKIAKLNNGLPDDFKYQWAASAYENNIVAINYKPDQTGFFLISAKPPKGEESESARELTNKLASEGLVGFSKEIKVHKSGTLPVAGENMEYIIGAASDSAGESAGAFVGSIVLKDKRSIVVFGLTPPQENSVKSQFNMDACNKFLSSISGF